MMRVATTRKCGGSHFPSCDARRFLEIVSRRTTTIYLVLGKPFVAHHFHHWNADVNRVRDSDPVVHFSREPAKLDMPAFRVSIHSLAENYDTHTLYFHS
eukprot:scaffold4201_cov178-Amphora_coffeaeformis.AAC.22